MNPTTTLDPTDWTPLRAQGHKMLDDMLDYLENIHSRPVWQPIPQEVRANYQQPLPQLPTDLSEVHASFMREVLPYAVGNAHPGFMGWVHGGGTAVGMLAEMLAAGLNANLGGRDQMPIEVERQVLHWVRELFDFPAAASGLFVTGTSMANLIAVWVARSKVLGTQVRKTGLAASELRLTAYTSAGAHGCIAQAMDLAGLGIDALRVIPMNNNFEMDVAALQTAITQDRAAGFTPFFIAATAGSVDVGAIDDLTAIANIAAQENIWFHIDGAYGALAMLSPELAPLLQGIERADSIAFDFHKWGQVPYDAGFILVRDGDLHLSTFSAPVAYLKRAEHGMAAGSAWPCDFGPDLSRGFRALKTWFTLKTYGTEKLGATIANTCALAQYMKQRIEAVPQLELLAPVALNIVCFRFRCEDADRVNAHIVVALQESGIVAPSTTTVNGCFAIRAAIVNHRTTQENIDDLLRETLMHGSALTTVSPLIGLAALMRMVFEEKDLKPLAAELTARTQRNPLDANAMLDLSTILQLSFQRELALQVQKEALKIQRIFSIPAAVQPAKIRLLVIMGACDLLSNTPVECLLENSDIALDMLYVSHDLPFPETVPDHDVLFVAISESDENQPLLQDLNEILRDWPRPILNSPDSIALLPRDFTGLLLGDISAVDMPPAARVSRVTLSAIATQQTALCDVLTRAEFPVIIRPFGSQAGRGLVKVEQASAIQDYLVAMTENEFYISPFVDYRAADGLFRKYRIVLIEGRPYICHLAISSNWLIHYLSAGMAESAEKRAEEQRGFANFDSDFALRHAPAFQAIYQRMGLDYLGIDCAETAAGDLLIFEVDSNMIIHAFDSVELFAYKQAQMQKVFAAFRTLLIKTGGSK
jgi:glutamate/tyrosine decarboxylase-like PLP-dependent enzyme/glutathione synthase/RimK-type ligase-like ATP-grasp enzyme